MASPKVTAKSCKVCGRILASDRKICIHCGAGGPIRKKSQFGKFWWSMFFGSLIGILVLSPDTNFSQTIQNLFSDFQEQIISLINYISFLAGPSVAIILFVSASVFIGWILNYLFDSFFSFENLYSEKILTYDFMEKQITSDTDESENIQDDLVLAKARDIGEQISWRIDRQIVTLAKTGNAFGKGGLLLALLYILGLVSLYVSGYSQIYDAENSQFRIDVTTFLLGAFVPALSFYLIRTYWGSISKIGYLERLRAQSKTDHLFFELMLISDPQNRHDLAKSYMDHYQRTDLAE